jgi:hypothetical protein
MCYLLKVDPVSVGSGKTVVRNVDSDVIVVTVSDIDVVVGVWYVGCVGFGIEFNANDVRVTHVVDVIAFAVSATNTITPKRVVPYPSRNVCCLFESKRLVAAVVVAVGLPILGTAIETKIVRSRE